MKKPIFLTFLFVFSIIIQIKAQQSGNNTFHSCKNVVYFELLGNGFLYSINYERIIVNSKNISLNARVGYSRFKFTVFNTLIDGELIPVNLNINYGKANNRIELGAGATFSTMNPGEKDEYKETNGVINLGYRYHPYKTKSNIGPSFRIGITNVVGPKTYLSLWPYASAGVAF
jgi:hypothetical protein